jgi:hypothetical protein
MKAKTKKTDKRYTGHEHFKYVVDVVMPYAPFIQGKPVNRRQQRIGFYHEVRKWCVDTWGMSCEREHWLTLQETGDPNINSHWCWHTELNDLKIYLTSEKEANWFKLRWT